MILRNVTITIAEVILTEGVEPPTASAAGQARAVADAPGSSAATVSDMGFTISVNAFLAGANNAAAGNAGGCHVDHRDDSPIVMTLESPAAGEKAVTQAGGDHDPGLVTAEAGAATIVAPPTVLDESTVAALVAKVGGRVRAAVANPPAAVEAPVELPLRRPVEEDTLDIPAFLDRRQERAHG